METRQRFEFIDALRGFAILGVMLTHVGSTVHFSGLMRRVTDLGGFGVQLFFVVSAFTIFLTYRRAIATERSPTVNFFIRRLFRIVPIYWLGIILYTAVYGLGPRGWKSGPELWHYPFHLTLTNIWVPTASNSVVPGGWSISVEVMFYLTAPLWIMLVRNLKGAILFTAIAAVVGLGAAYALQVHVPIEQLSYEESRRFWRQSVPSQMAIFGLGMILFYVFKDLQLRERLKGRGALIGLAASSAAVVALRFFGLIALPTHFIYAVAFLLAAIVLMEHRVPVIVNPITRWIGTVSYSSYILHFLVLKQLTLLLPLGGLSDVKQFFMLAPLTIAITLPAAYLSYLWIEKPTSQAARRLIAYLESRSMKDDGVYPRSLHANGSCAPANGYGIAATSARSALPKGKE